MSARTGNQADEGRRPSLRTLPHRLGDRRVQLGIAAIAATAEILPGVPAVLLVPAGLWLLLGAPAVLWQPVTARVVSTRDGQVVVSIGLAVLGDIVAALVLNTVLPPLGVPHPLSRLWLTAAAAVVILTMAVVCPPCERGAPGTSAVSGASTAPGASAALGFCLSRTVPPGLGTVVIAGGIAVALALAGAIRLNNGLGASTSVLAVVAVTVLLVLLMARRRRYTPGVVSIGLYLCAAGLLLLTSLRGWGITGHDIQAEYHVFELTERASNWNASSVREPYNACLSITLLPTALTRLTGIPGVYVFKVLLPLLFALAPVLVYRSVRNVAPQIIALLSVAYLMLFPTFWTDMPFMARQEVAFLLLGCALVVLTDAVRPVHHRRVAFTAVLVGIVLSHYSTAYVLLAVLGIALGVDTGWRWLSRLRRHASPVAAARGLVTVWTVIIVGAAAVIWAGPLTHTDTQARRTAVLTVQTLLGQRASDSSSDTAYSLFGGKRVSAEQRLLDYRNETVAQTRAGGAAEDYLPLSVVDEYPTEALELPSAPLTALGRLLQRTGLDVHAMNSLLRQGAAGLLQVLLVVGFVVTVLARRGGFRPCRDQVTLTIGAAWVVALLTVLPQLSVEYGVLRAFQQGLFLFAPFIAAGSIWIFRWSGRRAVPLACATATLLLLDLTGVVPKLVGGYPDQLHLANAGQYYDLYYAHPEERTAIAWLRRTTAGQEPPVQSELPRGLDVFTPPCTPSGDCAPEGIFPTVLSTRGYTVLGFTSVRKRQATLFYGGDLVTYSYPLGLLDRTKNKIYSSDGAEIYR